MERFTLTEVQLQIDDGDPVEIRIGWDGSLMNGHFMIVGGYSGSSLKILNPLNSAGSSSYYSHSSLVNGASISGGTAVWTHSIVNTEYSVTLPLKTSL